MQYKLNACLCWQVGDIIDDHSYPDSWSYGPTEDRASVLGEFGGLNLLLTDHAWVKGNDFGYDAMKNTTELQVSLDMTSSMTNRPIAFKALPYQKSRGLQRVASA